MCQGNTCHETFQHVGRREQRFLCRDANSSVVQFDFGFGSKKCRKSQTAACLDVSIAFLHAEMKDEVYIRMDADTLRLIREESLPNLQRFGDEGFHKVDKALYRYRGSPRLWKDVMSEAGTQTEQDRQFFVHGSQKLHSIRARGRGASLW